jgi:hypothetical protein
LGAGALSAVVSLGAAAQELAVQESAADPRQSAAHAEIEACVRDNAAKVERAVESLEDGVTFLVNRICAGAVSEYSRIAAEVEQQQRRARLAQICADAAGADPFDNAASQLAAQCKSQEFADAYSGGENVAYSTVVRLGGVAADPETISLAASLIMDARLARVGERAE